MGSNTSRRKMSENIHIEESAGAQTAQSHLEVDVPKNEQPAPVKMEDKTLFECIPEEIQVKIAGVILARQKNPPWRMMTSPPNLQRALNFSALCTNKTEVIRHALSSTMILTDRYQNQHDEAMLLIMGNKARALDITHRIDRALPQRINVDNLRAAKVRSKEEHMKLIWKAKQLKTLFINVEYDVSWDHLATAIGYISIEDLTLDMVILVEDQNHPIADALYLLPTIFPEVKKLTLMTTSYGMNERNSLWPGSTEDINLWPIILRMPKLESLFCQQIVAKVHIPS